MSKIIELKEVWKTYIMGEVPVHALRGINLTVRKGEFVSIQGPSGSGKSTAMFLVGCLDLPTKGHVFLDNKDISNLDESDLAQIRGKKIGFVFQRFNLLNTLTAMQNVQIPMMFQGVSEDKRIKRAEMLLTRVGLGERRFHKPTELSGGEMQRVAIARALANDPEVILADEPTGNLDSKTGKEVMQLLIDLHKKEKRTIIMVTHDKNVANLAERQIFLKDGQVVKGGK
ncbi:ABC transporter ATP-binding protein [archaeon]|jgi:putative ABC transport system ATP-binding protein|nr:ABC transporter ATP-binding protein [archaeon]MBT4396639.1 ABC transporter ATP-binding protein [archaeon]MBT4441249.1 ABC transporter ATP-binding protein [archaeon]